MEKCACSSRRTWNDSKENDQYSLSFHCNKNVKNTNYNRFKQTYMEKMNFLTVTLQILFKGARAEKPATYQYGAGWGHPEPRLLTRHGPRCPQHDHQQLWPFLEQVKETSKHKPLNTTNTIKRGKTFTFPHGRNYQSHKGNPSAVEWGSSVTSGGQLSQCRHHGKVPFERIAPPSGSQWE